MVQLKTILGLVCVALAVSVATSYDWAAASAALVSGGDPTPGPPVAVGPCEGDEKLINCFPIVTESMCDEKWSQVDTDVTADKKFFYETSARVCLDPINCIQQTKFVATTGCGRAK